MKGARVIVVGAGVIGLWCALRLAERGARVSLIDGAPLGSPTTTSYAAAGMLAPVWETVTAPKHVHPELSTLLFESFEVWRRQAAAFSGAARFQGAELLRSVGAARLARAASLAAEHGMDVRETKRGLFVSGEGVADPQRMMKELAAQAEALGVAFCLGARAIALAPGRCVSLADGGVVEADLIVLATGAAHGDAALAAPLQRITPAKGMIAPAALSRPIDGAVHGDGFYIAQQSPGAWALGATMAMGHDDLTPQPAAMAPILAAANAQLDIAVEIDAGQPLRVGVRPMSPDWAPMIGPVGGDVLLAAGHGRNGWLLAPLTAAIICGYASGDAIPPLWAAFHPDRFEEQEKIAP